MPVRPAPVSPALAAPQFPVPEVPAPQGPLARLAPETAHLRWEGLPDAFRPDYRRSLTGVFPTLFALLGYGAESFPNLLAHLPLDAPRRAKRGFVLCLDGFGFKQMAGSQRFRDLYPRCGTWLTSVFPSITSCALSSLYQALPPARHGILGHLVWKDFPGAVVDMLRMQVGGASAPLIAAGFDVQRWKREPGFLETPVGTALPGYHLMPYAIVGSGLSQYSYGKSVLVGFVEALEGFTKAAKILGEMSQGWVGLYLPTIDSLSHALGGAAPQVGLAARQIEEAFSWMVKQLPAQVVDDTLFMVIADHGQADLRHVLAWEGERREFLQLHTRAVGFSGRVMHLYATPEQLRELLPWLAEQVGDAGAVVPFDQARALVGLENGSAADAEWVRQTLGGAVVVLRDGYNWDKQGLTQSAHKPYITQLVSQHGGLTWDEMFVPWLCGPLSAMA